MTDHADSYAFFWNGPFSQWQRAGFELDGVTFNTAEQAMMHGKAMLFGDSEVAAKILAAPDPGKQKALGRQVRGFDEAVWDAGKVAIVRRANMAKFGQNRGLRRKLFQTGRRALVEASPMDVVWGIGLDAATARETPPDDWPGQNLLGRVLTEVREALRAKFPDEAAAVAVDGERA